MRYRVRRSWKEWQNIGASGQVLQWIREGVSIPFRHNRPPPPFNQGVSLLSVTSEQLAFVDEELEGFVVTIAWEDSTNSRIVSRRFLVPKHGNNQWRLICDLGHLKDYYRTRNASIWKLFGVRHLTLRGAYMLSFDMHDGFYALGIAQEFRDYFIVNVRGKIYRQAKLPMRWSLSPFHFCRLTETFVRHLRTANSASPSPPPWLVDETHEMK
jgi:hypothetical protein